MNVENPGNWERAAREPDKFGHESQRQDRHGERGHADEEIAPRLSLAARRVWTGRELGCGHVHPPVDAWTAIDALCRKSVRSPIYCNVTPLLPCAHLTQLES